MPKRSCFLTCLPLLTVLLSACRPQPTPLLQAVPPLSLPAPVMQIVECSFEDPEDQEVVCGTIPVPQDYDAGLTDPVDLQVIIYKSMAETPLPDPVVILGFYSGSLRFNLSRWMSSAFSDTRDVILFSRQPVTAPAGEDDFGLSCPEMATLTLEFLQQPRSRSEYSPEILATYQACMQRLAESGISLKGASARQTARDVIAIQQALGIPAMNVYGVGDTTFTALKILELDPAAVRSVILFSFHPPAALADLEHSFPVALQHLFQDCSADPACGAAYPDLETKFQIVIERLEANPLKLELQDPFSEEEVQLLIDGERFVAFVQAMLATLDSLGTVPAIIEAASTGDTARLAEFLQNAILFQLLLDELNLLSAGDCRENWTDRPVLDSGPIPLSPIVSQVLRSKVDLDRQVCSMKSQPELSLEEARVHEIQPVDVQVFASNLPLLVVHGAYDAVFGPRLVEARLREYRQAQMVILPEGSWLFIGGRCTAEIVSQFLEDPTRAVDASCAQDHPLEFILPMQ